MEQNGTPDTKHMNKNRFQGQAWLLMPVILALWEAEVGELPSSRVRDQPGQHGKTPSLLKIQKLVRHGGAHLQFQLLGRLRHKNCLTQKAWFAVSQERAIALHPG